jgi:hypothetical protein
MRVRTLKQLGKLINDLDNGYLATVRQSQSSTDTKIPGTRMLRPGRGRRGLQLCVFDPSKNLVLEHDTSETDRTVEEAVVKAVELFGDKLNVDPDEVLQVGDYVRVSDFGEFYGTVSKVTMRKGSKTRVSKYHVKLSRNGNICTFPSRKVFKLQWS